MTNELTDLTNIPAPTLTLDPVDDGEVAEASIIEVDSPAAPSLADSLSAEELAQVDAFAQQIDIANSQQVLTFGARRPEEDGVVLRDGAREGAHPGFGRGGRSYRRSSDRAQELRRG